LGPAAALLAALLCLPCADAALVEVDGRNPYTLTPAVAVGSYYDITLQIRNTGNAAVKLGTVSTTGPFTLLHNGCGASLAPGAVCFGNFGIRFAPTVAGPANGSLIVENDGPDGTFTLPLVATGSTLLAPTLTVTTSPAAIYGSTGVATLSFTLANPNAVPIVPAFFNVPLKAGFLTTAFPNATSSCGGAWFGTGDVAPASQPFVFFRGTGAQFIAPHASCTFTFDVVTTNGPGSYEVTWPQSFQTSALWSEQSPIVKLDVLAPIAGAPGAPTIATATGGNASATVTFTPPTSSGTAPITGYTVTSIPPGGVDAQAGGFALTRVVTGLANGTTYTLVVTATNVKGSGPPSAPSNPVTPGTTPGAPSNVIATAGNTQAIVTFAGPANTGGRPISGYVVTSNPPGGADANAGGTAQRHVITGLANGTAYTFAVTATNVLGNGPASAASNAVVPAATVIGQPPQVTYEVLPQRSAIPVPTPYIPPHPTLREYAFAYSSPRAVTLADLDGDGRTDILIAPTYGQNPPFFPIEIWLSNADGTFRNGTAEAIDGAPPVTRGVDNILIADFNGDGRPDAFFGDTGIEQAVALGLPDSGAKNSLLLSRLDGRYGDATPQIVPGTQAFHHSSVLGDFNGDGIDDVAVVRFTSSETDEQGLLLLLSDGAGRLAESTVGLPPEIASMPQSQNNYQVAQDVSCVGAGDLDGDGRSDLLTASGYQSAEPGGRTLRIFRQQENGAFVERNRFAIPDALKDIGEVSAAIGADGRGLGCAGSGIVVADLNDDGRDDVIVPWEGAGKMYLQILRNDGNFQFTDVTVEWLGSYSANFLDGPYAGPGQTRVLDMNGDGTPDLAYFLNATSATNILRHAVMLNDGTGHFTPWRPQGANGDLTAAEILAVAKCTNCSVASLFSRIAPGSLPSMILSDSFSDVTAAIPAQTKTVFLTTVRPVATQTVPEPPRIGIVVGGDGQATVSFAPPAHDGGSPILGYTVTSSRGDGVDLHADSPSLRHVVGSLINGIAHTFTVKARNALGTSLASGPSRPTIPGSNLVAAPNYTGLWWAAPAGSESGWGINFTHQGDTIFATWFTYGNDGKPLWLAAVLVRGDDGVYRGDAFTVKGVPFDAQPWDASQVVETIVGTISVAFADTTQATMSYTVNGVSRTKAIVPQIFGEAPSCVWGLPASLAFAVNYQGLWWATPAGSESGWGINLTHQGDTIFATWFTYGADGKPTWFVALATKGAAGAYAGTIYTVTGPAFEAPFDTSQVIESAVGTASFTFLDGNNAEFAYEVAGVAQVKPITRQVFTAPGTVCY
jgi:hypothetical protein